MVDLSFTSGWRRLLRSMTLIRATGVELAVLAGHLLLYPTGVFQELGAGPDAAARGGAGGALAERRISAAPCGSPPVLLLHGFVDNRSVFALLARNLRRNGWRCVQSLNYSLLTCDVRDAAALLGQHVERACEQSGHQRVDIVGHSLGGLIARYYVQRLGGDARVRTLITLGTPHSGTRAIRFANPHPLIRQMRPNSELLRELGKPAIGCTTHFVAFWSDLDEFMVPAETARLDHPDLAVRNVGVPGIGHLTFPVNGAVAVAIRQTLTDEEELGGAVDAA
ncbi:esterase/lipase family protein [Streptantibioticus ferralitis]|uniref:Alpha/beta fold hydrolase n=1 Tax=Streptantibioticus ferralitis TaxID=236510 RepID=A0ABT5Z2M9_9ACTN|nr:alpha/beta fold hydrolase [Streptantibioticus ferralitis]MDF2257927.1 alpha/beta fold hydrolase [Streptantibioticus ferralitis]